MIIHHMKATQVAHLETVFAKMTENGWTVPDWIRLLWSTMRYD